MRSSSMDSSSYTPLLEKTRLPQPSFQRYAVISIFEKLKSAPPSLGVESDPGRYALSHCLTSTFAAVVDQAVGELCRLVKSGHIKVSLGLIELQSALEGCDSRFVNLHVKGIGFLCRFAFRNDPPWGRQFSSPELHPFVKVLSCRVEVQAELGQQVVLFIVHNIDRSVGAGEVSEFVRPFLMFCVLRVPISPHFACFTRDLISSVASLSCSLRSGAVSIIKLLVSCLKYFPCKNEEDFKYLIGTAEYLVDALMVIFKQMAGTGMSMSEAQTCGLELLEAFLSIRANQQKTFGGSDLVVELSKRLLQAQKELGLQYLPEFVSVALSLSILLTQVEFEHEQLSILKLLVFLTEWRILYCDTRGTKSCVSQELVLFFPVVNVLSSPSKPVKTTATYLLSLLERLLLDLLVAPKEVQFSPAGSPSASKPEFIVCRLLHHLWFQEESLYSKCYFLEFVYDKKSEMPEGCNKLTPWISRIQQYCSSAADRPLIPVPHSQENVLIGMPLLMCTVASILVLHPTFAESAVNSLATIGVMDPKTSMSLLLAILFYSNFFCNHKSNSHDVLLKLLEVLPLLASHSVMVPLVIQTILPMLHKDTRPVLYATAVRLLCKTWIVTDRAFGSLQEILDPKTFSKFISNRDISISIAASVRDVCRHNPDRGVDLILSLSFFIESGENFLQALGFESLAYLCEADVLDFYTAWNVIGRHVLDYSVDPVVAHGLCFLLRWGAMDAEAYFEASKSVIQILWDVGTSRDRHSGSFWVKARVSAFESLAYYEIDHVQKCIPDFKERNLEILVSEDDANILKAMEGFQVKIINFEHTTRRRLLKEKRVMVHKVEKLLDVFPQVMFDSGRQTGDARELPGAALLSLVFTPKDLQGRGASKDLLRIHATYKNALLEVAESLQLSRNILVALLALQSWKAFMNRWIRAVIMFNDAKTSSNMSVESSKAFNDILKIVCDVAEESIPQVSENIALAIGALCMVLPPSAHPVTSSASQYLLKWLSQYEHEHRQWSAAISLGLLSNCLHATDRTQKLFIIDELLKVLCHSRSYLVKGACGVGLGFASQNLLADFENDDDSDVRGIVQTESMLLGKIEQSFSLIIRQLCPSSNDSLNRLNENLPLGGDNKIAEEASNFSFDKSRSLEMDVWGVAGLVLGLGNSVFALYKSGAIDAVLKIKDILLSWIPTMGSYVQKSHICNEMLEIPLCVGSCLVLPSVVAFCQRVELMDDELDAILTGYRSLISELLVAKKSGPLHQNLLMASCSGAGSLLAFVLEDGVHHMKLDDVKCLIEVMRNAYSHSYPPSIHLGGMLGVVNAFGAGAGILTHLYPQSSSLQIDYVQKESSYIRGPILSSPLCETITTSVIQEMFLVAKDSKDQQVRRYAAWAISFLRHRWWSKEFPNMKVPHSDSIDSKPTPSFAEDSLVWKLYSWLSNFQDSELGAITHVNTVAATLRCLAKSPRLPSSSDWGVIIRRCMRHGVQSVKPHMNQTCMKLREECINFSLAHANHVNALLLFLDELVDLSRFRTLELNLQSCLLRHLSDLMKIFSGSRLEKLYNDLIGYLSSSLYLVYDPHQKCIVRISFWKGLHQCLIEASTKLDHKVYMEKCMELLSSLLPVLTSGDSSKEHATSEEEWSEALQCLAKARQSWLMDLLLVSDMDLVYGGSLSVDIAKYILIAAGLVTIGCFPVSELGRFRFYIFNKSSDGIWDVLIAIGTAVSRADGNIKRQWLLDAVEISCTTPYPSTALQFVGLLSGGCCEYMPLLVLDPIAVVSDLPVTLCSLLSDSSWSVIAEPLVAKLWASTERISAWATQICSGDEFCGPNHIDGSENHVCVFLARVMHQTCVLLKDYLPFEKQLRLANLLVP